MTRDDFIRMAQECQLIGMRPHLDGIYEASLERFAELVARKLDEEYPVKFASVKAFEDWCAAIRANEREACAKLADKYMERWTADAIRAQDNQTTIDTTGEVCFPSATQIQWKGPEVLTLDYDGRIWPPGTKAPSHKLTVTKLEEKK